MQGSHVRRSAMRSNGGLGRGTIVGVVIVAALLTAWVFRGALGLGDDTTANAATTRTGDHTALTHVDTGVPIDASKALSSGPISELDKELLVKVRLANLWELPAGRLAQENGSLEQVKRAGLHLLEGHSRLDQMVREIAQALDVPIPDQPNADQQGWLKTLRTSKGEEFDRFFANQLREAHGKVFVVIAQVRATTRNSIIRDLAIEANKQVADHMEVLEDTGLVEAKTLEAIEADVNK
jgi:predicted outer membrane protein